MTTRASACNPIDFVLAAGFVRVTQNFISEFMFTLIDFGVDIEAVWAAEGSRVGRRNYPSSLSRNRT
jgi:hypothetical protein